MKTTLHAIWSPPDAMAPEGEFLVWAEGGARRNAEAVDHPFALSGPQLVHSLWQLWRSLSVGQVADRARQIPLLLPTVSDSPLRSGDVPPGPVRFKPWRVDVVAFGPQQVLNLLLELPAYGNTVIDYGPSLKYWRMAARLVGAALVRGQYLPTADADGRGRWQLVWMDTALQTEAAALANALPVSARALPRVLPPALELVHSFVSHVAHAFLSTAHTPTQSPFFNPKKYMPRPNDPRPADLWWLDLFARARHNLSTTKRSADQQAFGERVRAWSGPVADYLNSQYRVAFRLEPPQAQTEADAETPWRLSFHLQPKDGRDTLYAAGEVWAAPQDEQMPEILRAGLAQALGVYPRLAPALAEPAPEAVALTVEEAVAFLERDAAELSGRGFGVLVPTWWRDRQRRLRARLSVGRSEGFGLMGMEAVVDFNWQLAVGDQTLTLDELQQLAQSKTSLVQVRGEWIQFDRAEVDAALRLIQRHQQSNGRMALREALGLALTGQGEWQGLELAGVDADDWLRDVVRRLQDTHSLELLEQPAPFVGQLRPYQVNGLSWLAFMRQYGFGACLADDMGLGKTIQFLALLARDIECGQLHQPVLLVCPTTVVANWVREAATFVPQLKTYAHHGPTRLRGDAFLGHVAGQHLVLTSYALLPRDAELFEQVSWGGVVLDEAHNIKNPATKQAQVARKLRGGYRVSLTGTPLENRLQDLWSIMHFLNPGYLGSSESFQREYAGPIERGMADGAADRLRALTRPFILRRLKTDQTIIQDLPPKLEMKEYCGLTKEQAALYRAVVQESLRQINETQGIQRRGVILATLTKLKQVCNHPRHLLGDQSALMGRSGKLNRLTEMLEQALSEDDRVLIFTQYAEMGDLLSQHLTATFGETLYLYGGTPAPKRAEMIARFQNGGPRLFVLSLKAGGAGINLTRANRVFHYDRWWNPAVENQATDRAFRIGQTQTVQVHKMVCRGTLEERIDELITRKTELAEQIVGSGETWLTELTTDELRDLLTLRREAIDE